MNTTGFKRTTRPTIKPSASNSKLKAGTIIHNQDTGEEWMLLEDVKDDCAKCQCTYVPDISRYTVSSIEDFRIFYRNGNMAFHWKLGKNLNNK